MKRFVINRVAMRCNEEQFNEIKNGLNKLGVPFHKRQDFDILPYLGLIENEHSLRLDVANISEVETQNFVNVYYVNNAKVFLMYITTAKERFKTLGEIEMPPTSPTYDRAEMATKILCAMIPVLKTTDTELIADDAVKITDALIERLNQKP